MGWFQGAVSSWASRTKIREIEDFTRRMAACDSSELGLPLAMAAKYRQIHLDAHGADLMLPHLCLLARPTLALDLIKQVQQLQQERMFVLAAPLLIWVHTLRAAEDLLVRPHGRAMWAELSRGFPYLRPAVEKLLEDTGERIRIFDFEGPPDGLGPRT